MISIFIKTILKVNFFFLLIVSGEYEDILIDLSKQWILNENGHRVSKEASECFWRIANNMFHRLHVAARGRKVPQLAHLRNKMNDRHVPKVSLEIGYMEKSTGEIEIVKDSSITPVSRFPPFAYKRLYEIASVDVSMFYRIILL